MFWFLGPEACGILAPRPGIEPAPSALEGKVLTSGPPGKSAGIKFFSSIESHLSLSGIRIDSGQGK